ncbi:MAG: GIY-YIG nuclease family protein [Cyclobacteriaceae bacterium]
MEAFFVYIIQSEKDSTFYIGYTSNLERRITQHNESKSGYTSRKKPWKLVYAEEFSNKSEALIREKFIKKQKNKDFYKKLINSWSGSSVG